MKTQARAGTMITTSMVIFGTIGLFVKKIPLGSAQIALFRALCAMLLVGSFLILRKKTMPMSTLKKPLLPLALSGIAMGFNWILLFESYKYTTVTKATLSYYFAPVLVTLASALIFKEKLGLRKILCFVAATLGLVIITCTGSGAGSNDLFGIALGLAAATLYASVVLLNKHIGQVDGLSRTLAQFVAAALVLLPYVMFTEGFDLGHLDAGQWGLLLTLGIVHTGIAYCMYFSAIKLLPGQKAAILSYIDPLVAVVLSLVVLHEAMPLWQVLSGCGLILGGTLLNAL